MIFPVLQKCLYETSLHQKKDVQIFGFLVFRSMKTFCVLMQVYNPCLTASDDRDTRTYHYSPHPLLFSLRNYINSVWQIYAKLDLILKVMGWWGHGDTDLSILTLDNKQTLYHCYSQSRRLSAHHSWSAHWWHFPCWESNLSHLAYDQATYWFSYIVHVPSVKTN
jgi:hypothetical protein